MKTLSKEQVLRLHNALLETFGGTAGVRDDGLLESALNAPFATFGGQYLYPSVQAKAAQLGFGLVCNHPFVDGNKRIGAHVMLVFLAINGIELDYTQEELIDIILGLHIPYNASYRQPHCIHQYDWDPLPEILLQQPFPFLHSRSSLLHNFPTFEANADLFLNQPLERMSKEYNWPLFRKLIFQPPSSSVRD